MASQDLTLDDLKLRAIGMMDAPTTDSHYGALVTAWINDGLMRMCMEGEGIEDLKSFTTVAGTRAYTLPVVTDATAKQFIRAKMVLYDGRVLDYNPILNLDFFSSGNSPPDKYTIWNGQILLGPSPPDAAETLDVYYVREPLLLSAAGDKPEIPNRFRSYLADYAASMQMMADGDLNDARALMASYEAGVARYRHWAVFKSKQNYVQVIGEVDY